MQKAICLAIVALFCNYAVAQDFSSEGFAASFPCQLEKALDTASITSFQCVVQTGPQEATIYRVNVQGREQVITDRDTYFDRLAQEYQSMGQSSKVVSYEGEKAVRTRTEVSIQRHPFDQWSLDLLRGRRSYTLVLVSNGTSMQTNFNCLKDGFEMK